MVHELKIAPEYFKDVQTGLKKFEIRKNDRAFKVGDRLSLKEWNSYHYTGKSINVVVTYITDYMQKKGTLYWELNELQELYIHNNDLFFQPYYWLA